MATTAERMRAADDHRLFSKVWLALGIALSIICLALMISTVLWFPPIVAAGVPACVFIVSSLFAGYFCLIEGGAHKQASRDLQPSERLLPSAFRSKSDKTEQPTEGPELYAPVFKPWCHSEGAEGDLVQGDRAKEFLPGFCNFGPRY